MDRRKSHSAQQVTKQITLMTHKPHVRTIFSRTNTPCLQNMHSIVCVPLLQPQSCYCDQGLLSGRSKGSQSVSLYHVQTFFVGLGKSIFLPPPGVHWCLFGCNKYDIDRLLRTRCTRQHAAPA